MTSRIRLWLDDLRPAPPGWTHVRTAREAVDLLTRGLVVQISLDHDLGDDGAGTGYDVAVWIEEQAATGQLTRPLAWAVHSANPVGRTRIEAAMRSAERWRASFAETKHLQNVPGMTESIRESMAAPDEEFSEDPGW